MAAKKKTKPRRKKSTGLSGGGKKRRTRRSPSKSKGLLSDATNPTMLMNSAKFAVSAGVGGLAGIHVAKWMNPAASKLQKAAAIFAIGFLGCSFGYPNVAAGAIGAMTAQAFPNGLNDDANYAAEDSLSDKPIYLDDDGNPMVLEEGEGGASYRYLSDDEIELMEREGAFDEYTPV